jgi:ubiquinone/menaquinone biosynthesis C-methylase UbiE
MRNLQRTDLCPDDIDWIGVWRDQKIRQLSTPYFKDSLEFWSDSENVGRLYTRNNGAGRKILAKQQIRDMNITPGARVLDIGAGTGSLSVPLARTGCQVTAIEPAGAMIEAFQENVRRESVSDITLIRKKWEDVDEEELDGQFDTVVASFSLSMTEIGDALIKMDHVCRGSVCLYWFMTPLPSSKAMHDLWPKVHGTPHYYEPLADCLFMVLLQLGIYPNLEMIPEGHAHSYATIGDAVTDFHRRMGCTTENQDTIIRRYLRTHLCLTRNEFRLRGNSRNVKIVWQKKTTP